MYGANEAEPLLKDGGYYLDVVDVFPTIQGEGPFAGRPATFVRLAGCHLRCGFCDTDFTTNRRQMSVLEVCNQILNLGHRLVVVTGGEPMRQNLAPLCWALIRAKLLVQIETAGSFWHKDMSERYELGGIHIVVSPKTPYVCNAVVARADSWKYVITDLDPLGADGLPMHSTQPDGQHRPLARPPGRIQPWDIYLQPCDMGDASRNAAITKRCVDLCLKHGYRLSLQQHKILGLP